MENFSIETLDDCSFREAWPLISECLETYEPRLGSLAPHKEFLLEIIKHPAYGVLHCCKLEGNYIGFSIMYFTCSTYYAGRVALLNDLYVSANYRRRGVARALKAKAIDEARKRGILIMQWLNSHKNSAILKFNEEYDAYGSDWRRFTLRL